MRLILGAVHAQKHSSVSPVQLYLAIRRTARRQAEMGKTNKAPAVKKHNFLSDLGCLCLAVYLNLPRLSSFPLPLLIVPFDAGLHVGHPNFIEKRGGCYILNYPMRSLGSVRLCDLNIS